VYLVNNPAFDVRCFWPCRVCTSP